jgi:predicted GNAT superfamily acetyltransferase
MQFLIVSTIVSTQLTLEKDLPKNAWAAWYHISINYQLGLYAYESTIVPAVGVPAGTYGYGREEYRYRYAYLLTVREERRSRTILVSGRIGLLLVLER